MACCLFKKQRNFWYWLTVCVHLISIIMCFLLICLASLLIVSFCCHLAIKVGFQSLGARSLILILYLQNTKPCFQAFILLPGSAKQETEAGSKLGITRRYSCVILQVLRKYKQTSMVNSQYLPSGEGKNIPPKCFLANNVWIRTSKLHFCMELPGLLWWSSITRALERRKKKHTTKPKVFWGDLF